MWQLLKESQKRSWNVPKRFQNWKAHITLCVCSQENGAFKVQINSVWFFALNCMWNSKLWRSSHRFPVSRRRRIKKPESCWFVLWYEFWWLIEKTIVLQNLLLFKKLNILRANIYACCILALFGYKKELQVTFQTDVDSYLKTFYFVA